jgi:hypothetical protein
MTVRFNPDKVGDDEREAYLKGYTDGYEDQRDDGFRVDPAKRFQIMSPVKPTPGIPIVVLDHLAGLSYSFDNLQAALTCVGLLATNPTYARRRYVNSSPIKYTKEN